MKILLVAPQSKDTILGAIGGSCKKALLKLGYRVSEFDFRRSQYLRNPAGDFLRRCMRKIFPVPSKIPIINYLQTEKMNESLLAFAKKSRPDVMLTLMGDSILPDTIKEIKRMGVVSVNWFQDTILAPIRRDFIARVSSCYDYFFIIDSPAVFDYCNVPFAYRGTINLACDSEVHKNLNLSDREKKIYGSEVCFVGTVKFNRREVLAQLAEFNLGIWGKWSEKYPQLRRCYRWQHVYAEDAVKIYNSAGIVLDIPVAYGDAKEPFYVTPRVFEVPACGAFLLTKENPVLYDLYEVGKEIICYKDTAELKSLVKYYLAHPQERRHIAENGQRRAHSDHTYEKRLAEMLLKVRG